MYDIKTEINQSQMTTPEDTNKYFHYSTYSSLYNNERRERGEIRNKL